MDNRTNTYATTLLNDNQDDTDSQRPGKLPPLAFDSIIRQMSDACFRLRAAENSLLTRCDPMKQARLREQMDATVDGFVNERLIPLVAEYLGDAAAPELETCRKQLRDALRYPSSRQPNNIKLVSKRGFPLSISTNKFPMPIASRLPLPITNGSPMKRPVLNSKVSEFF